jgi:molybdenum cofactor cytidylyltransferase
LDGRTEDVEPRQTDGPASATLFGLVPAAGRSRRMGRDKRLVRWRGRCALEHTVESLRQGGITEVIVVLEPGSPCAALDGLRACTLVTNPLPERGMLSSIRAGLEHLPPTACAVAVLPGDHPFVPADGVRALIRFYFDRHPLLLAPQYGQRRGHPLIIDRTLFAAASSCSDDIGLRQLLALEADRLVLLPLDYPEAENDLDRPEDLERLER